MALADWLEQATHSPNDAIVQSAYESFASESLQQWNVIASAGYRIEPWLQDGQPYRSSHEMFADVYDKHLYFFLTNSGFGQAKDKDQYIDHKLLQLSGVVVNSISLCFNDIFRAVHDIFGHAVEYNQFGPIGEEKAWRCHSQMFSPTARAALTTETRAQNCWVNFGPHMRHPSGTLREPDQPGYLKPADRPYGPQKIAIPPEVFIFGTEYF